MCILRIGRGSAAEEAAEAGAGAGAGAGAAPAEVQLRHAQIEIEQLQNELRKRKQAKTNKSLEPSDLKVKLNRRGPCKQVGLCYCFLMLILVVWCVVATILAATCLPCRKEEGED